jgi:anti-sigma factor RsiW
MTEEAKHESWTEKLDLYLDGELDANQMKDLEGHLRECPACTGEVLRRLQWKRAIHTAGRRYFTDSSLRERVEKNISPRKAAWWHWRPAFAATAALLLLLAGARMVQLEIRPHAQHAIQESMLVSELVDAHISTLASANPVDVVSTDRHNVKPWFAGKIPFTFDLPDLQGSPFELVGGRVSYLDQTPGAQLLFRVRKHQISVFIFQARAVHSDLVERQAMDAQSFHLESWQRDRLQYFAISDVAPGDLRALADLLKK